MNLREQIARALCATPDQALHGKHRGKRRWELHLEQADRVIGIMSETEALLSENAALKEQVRSLLAQKDGMYERMLEWRGISLVAGDRPCPTCGGSGIKVYGSTSTWRGGIGGQMMTQDVCDKCWGSGNAEKPWLNLRGINKIVRV